MRLIPGQPARNTTEIGGFWCVCFFLFKIAVDLLEKQTGTKAKFWSGFSCRREFAGGH